MFWCDEKILVPVVVISDWQTEELKGYSFVGEVVSVVQILNSKATP